jgi:ABC-2 type transport system permease protein
MWAVLLAAIGLALASLSGRRAYATGAIAIYFFLTYILAGILITVTERNVMRTAMINPPAGAPRPPGVPATGPIQVHFMAQVPTTASHLSGLVSPFTTLEGVRLWLGGTSKGPLPGVGGYGALYGAMFLALLAASVGALFARYRKAGTL